MTAYLITIITTSIIIALSEMILPNGKLKVVVSTVFSITILFTVLNAVNSISEEDFEYVFNFENDQTESENLNYINEHFDKSTAKYYQTLYITQLKDQDLIAERVNVEICNLEIVKVEVFLSNLVIPTKNEHINNNVIKSYVSKVLNLSEEKVYVYVWKVKKF